jgi:hypothetical protein
MSNMKDRFVLNYAVTYKRKNSFSFMRIMGLTAIIGGGVLIWASVTSQERWPLVGASVGGTFGFFMFLWPRLFFRPPER